MFDEDDLSFKNMKPPRFQTLDLPPCLDQNLERERDESFLVFFIKIPKTLSKMKMAIIYIFFSFTKTPLIFLVKDKCVPKLVKRVS